MRDPSQEPSPARAGRAEVCDQIERRLQNRAIGPRIARPSEALAKREASLVLVRWFVSSFILVIGISGAAPTAGSGQRRTFKLAGRVISTPRPKRAEWRPS